MSAKATLLFSLALFLLFSKASAANITKVLNQYPDFSNFNDYLSKTGVAAGINSHQTVTVLAVDNGAISPLSGKPDAVIKRILSVHVILDYYDVKKLENLNKSAIVTTLFQESGVATGRTGFLNLTVMSGKNVAIGSEGESLGANLVKSIASEPYNLSVLQISTLIIPTGIDNTTSSNNKTSPSPSPSPKKPPSPRRAPSPKSSDSPAPSKSAGSPPKPADAPAADSPAHDDNSQGLTLKLHLFFVLMIACSTLWVI